MTPPSQDAPSREQEADSPSRNGGPGDAPPDDVLERRVQRVLARMQVREEVSRARMRADPDEETARLDEVAVTRDPKTGEIEPLKRKTPLNGAVVEFLPLTYRDQKRYGLDNRGLLQLGHEERVEFLREHVVSPDLSELESLDDLRFSYVEDLLMVIAAHGRDQRWKDLPRPAGEEEGGKD